MATISFKAEESKFNGYTEGSYEAQIKEVKLGTSSTKKAQIKVTFSGKGFGKFTYYIYDTPFGRADLFSLYEACGIDTTRDDVDTDELIDKYVTIEIKQRMNADGTPYLWDDKPQWDIASISSADSEDEDDEEDDWDA